MAEHLRKISMLSRLERSSSLTSHSVETSVWSFCPTLGIAWQKPAGNNVNRFIYQELRSRLVRRSPRFAHAHIRAASGLGRSGRFLLRTSDSPGPRLSEGEAIVIFGKRRTRILDFATRTATTVDLEGVSTIGHEVAARRHGNDTHTTKIVGYSIARGTMTERLEPGFNLATYGTATRLVPQVTRALNEWRRGTEQQISFDEYRSLLETESPRLIDNLKWQKLLENYQGPNLIEVAASHGDLQPSNILQTPSGNLLLLDFEHFATRWSPYDLEVFASGLRWKGADGGSSSLREMEELRFLIDRSTSPHGKAGLS